MENWAYTPGLRDLGNHIYAYLQCDGPRGGTWGWSNAGLVSDGQESLLVDTLYDLIRTQEMLDTMHRMIPASAHIGMLVNSHSNGDHCNGNQLVAAEQRIVSLRTAEEMSKEPPPSVLGRMLRNAPPEAFIHKALGAFSFTDAIVVPPPTQTFEGELRVQVGTKEVRLIEVGPAHTSGDTLIYVPEDRVLYSGDILFVGGHPVMWAGPTENWLRACDRILALDVETIVPGHGPLTDKQGVRAIKDYLQYVFDEAKQRFEAGMSAYEAALDIPMDRYATWQDGERIVVNVATIYRHLRNAQDRDNVHVLFGQMEQYLRTQETTR